MFRLTRGEFPDFTVRVFPLYDFNSSKVPLLNDNLCLSLLCSLSVVCACLHESSTADRMKQTLDYTLPQSTTTACCCKCNNIRQYGRRQKKFIKQLLNVQNINLNTTSPTSSSQLPLHSHPLSLCFTAIQSSLCY